MGVKMSDDKEKDAKSIADEIKADLEADRIEARLLSKKYGREITVEQMWAVEYHVRKEAREHNPSDFDKFSEVVKNSIYESKDNDLNVFVDMQKEDISQRKVGQVSLYQNFMNTRRGR